MAHNSEHAAFETHPVSQQPNSVDCGLHVMMNGRSLVQHLAGGGSFGTWVSGGNSLAGIRKFRTHIAKEIMTKGKIVQESGKHTTL